MLPFISLWRKLEAWLLFPAPSLPPSSLQDRLLSLEGLSHPHGCLALPGHSRGFLSNVLLRSFTSSGLPTLS